MIQTGRGAASTTLNTHIYTSPRRTQTYSKIYVESVGHGLRGKVPLKNRYPAGLPTQQHSYQLPA